MSLKRKPKSNSFTVDQAHSWLAEHGFGHVVCVKWSDTSKYPSDWMNTQNGFRWTQPFSNIRSMVRDGYVIGLTKEERLALRKQGKTLRTFPVVRVGSGPPMRKPPMAMEAALAWLHEHGYSHIECVHWAGSSKKKSLWRNTSNGREFESEFNHLKINHNRPNRLIGATWGETLEAKKQTSLAHFGVDHPLKSPEVLEKHRQTCLARYGVPNIALYNAPTYQGKTVREWSQSLGYSKEHTQRLIHTLGIEETSKKVPYQSSIESVLRAYLDELGVVYTFNRKLRDTDVRPDVVIEDLRIVIEVDGVYYHSDAHPRMTRSYHVTRRQKIIDAGYRPLFFREDEVLFRTDAVRSVLLHALKRSTKVYGRKTDATRIPVTDAKLFFEKYHLMGSGHGRTYALTLPGTGIVAAMCIKGNSSAEISRFCTRSGLSVVGGFSKLLAFAREVEGFTSVSTFVDLRYGTGSYLPSIGFRLKSCHPSFKWVKGMTVKNRMVYPGNTGYAHGYHKLWDCGQARFEASL